MEGGRSRYCYYSNTVSIIPILISVDEGTETEKLSDLPYLLQNQEPAIARFQNDLTAYL